MSEKKEYIERGAALKAVEGAVSSENVIDNINTIPAADVEPVVRGEWERFEEQEFFTIYDGLKCSICGSKYNPESAKNYKFCPNCGAHMERSESGE